MKIVIKLKLVNLQENLIMNLDVDPGFFQHY